VRASAHYALIYVNRRARRDRGGVNTRRPATRSRFWCRSAIRSGF